MQVWNKGGVLSFCGGSMYFASDARAKVIWQVPGGVA
jgi:hypothetical protein